jgi:hypothetical protein
MDPLLIELTSLHSLIFERFEYIIIMLALAMVLAWGCCINLYATLFSVGIMTLTGHAHLPSGLSILENHAVIAIAGLMYITDLFLSRFIRGDMSWDIFQICIYIPAGGLLAAGTVTDYGMVAMIGIGVTGACLTYLTYNSILGAKLYLFNRSESFSPLSSPLIRDTVLLTGLWTCTQAPMLLIALLIGFIIFAYS